MDNYANSGKEVGKSCYLAAGIKPSMDTAAMMAEVRRRRPLVVHVTNVVTINDCANVCIAAGGSPCMSMSPSDAAELARVSDAVVVNIGTPDSEMIGDALLSAARTAATMKKPLIIDPAGAGASIIRTALTKKILSECVKLSPSTCIIKGNAGEIGFLSGIGGQVRGVDSAGASDAEQATRSLAQTYGCIVSCTGPTDYVSDGNTTLALSRGTPMEETVSGTGCMVSSVTACYAGACGVSVESAAAAITAFNIAAEKAAAVSAGPGTFHVNLIDSIYNLREEDFRCSNSTP